MAEMDDVLQICKGLKIALYGLGTETERFLSEHGSQLQIIGLLDGFRDNGKIYGYPIISIEEARRNGVRYIIVVARPGSCKAIMRRIGDYCRKHGILLYDVRGKDLLAKKSVSYDFSLLKGESKKSLYQRIVEADVISFDLFDTLITRKVFSYTDLFSLVDLNLKQMGIEAVDFASIRLGVEKELSREYAPTLEEIYADVLERTKGVIPLSAEELADMEWETDFSTMLPRDAACEVFRRAVEMGKTVAVTTDSYYRGEQIERILAAFDLSGYDGLYISCEEGAPKERGLFQWLAAGEKRVLHIGDDETADIKAASEYGIDTYRIFNGADMYDALGGVGTEDCLESLSDRLKVGMCISRLFNDPFVFESEDRRIRISDAYGIGYVLCAPLISDFVHWLRDEVRRQGIKQMLFCARDGYLLERLYRMVDDETESTYFLTSRTAAVRAGMENRDDISYVDSMKFFGTERENLRMRFGIETDKNAAISDDEKNNLILNRAKRLRRHYLKYIDGLDLADEKIAFVDFVAKGTTQMYIQRLFRQHLKGFYFLQLEPEFMANKGLDIEPYYAEAEKIGSEVFDNYYILETVLTSPRPSVDEFEDGGKPVYAGETRSGNSIECVLDMQKGITDFFLDYIRLLPESEKQGNKRLDEAFLSLINHIKIRDVRFLDLKVEDPFFGRMTDMEDVVG